MALYSSFAINKEDNDCAMDFGIDPSQTMEAEDELLNIRPDQKNAYLSIRNRILKLWHCDYINKLINLESVISDVAKFV